MRAPSPPWVGVEEAGWVVGYRSGRLAVGMEKPEVCWMIQMRRRLGYWEEWERSEAAEVGAEELLPSLVPDCPVWQASWDHG